ncbi:MAG: carbonate dehydratase [bacterium]
MRSLDHLLTNNRRWAAEMRAADPKYFERLVAQQKPQYLWIGCSDSRVPANVIVGLPPGELFVHRNVANVVVHTDFNCLSVLEFAIDVLGVRDIMVCGHYGCGGVRAALGSAQLGLCDNWLRHIRDVHQKHEALLRGIEAPDARLDRLCELNVIEQVANVCHTTLVQSAWRRGQELSVHGWIYGIQDGVLRDLGTTMSGPDDISSVYHVAVEAR